MDQQSHSSSVTPAADDGFIKLSAVTGSSRILAVTDRLGLGATIFLACSMLSALTTALALMNHHLNGDPIGVTGLINSTGLPFLLGVPVLYVLLTLCRRLEVTRAELARLSSIDMLTGVMNRRSLLAWAEAACAEVRAQEETPGPLSLALLDADRFKLVNDQHGHLTGDAVLRRLATVATQTLPANCPFGRFGGEEFAILMPQRDADTALALAESLRAAVESECHQIDGKRIDLTISLGVTTCVDGQAHLETLLSQADEALYAAKRAGRNRVLAWSPAAEYQGSVNVIPI